jgi:hypothetical protein
VDLVVEPFEHGTMIWRADTRQIIVLFADGTATIYRDRWQAGDPLGGTETAPPGRYAPVRGFGLLWMSEPAVRDRLGWALAPEQAAAGTVQATSNGIALQAGSKVYALTSAGALVEG